ncbi:MAG: Hcp family type VI secretion system effector [Thiohalomonadales bacterium]
MSIYLKMDGIKGNVTTKDHEDWIDVESIQWRVVRAINKSILSNSNWETSKTGISEVSITKLMDASSPLIFTEACEGKSQKTQIHLSNTNSSKPGKITTYMKYELEDCIVSSYSVSSEGEIPTESITFSFTKMSMKFIPHDKSGKALSPIPAGYDMVTGSLI